MDFYEIRTREKKDGLEIYPEFMVGRSKDLMIRGKAFYAIWDEAKGMWSTDEYDVPRLMDAELHEYARKLGVPATVKDLKWFSTNSWTQFKRLVKDIGDSHQLLDQNLTFANTEVKKSDYVSRRLPYALEPGDFSAWDELVGTLYSVDERAKIEWVIGAIVAGDAKKIQKFLVFYGSAGTGKSTILGIVEKLFEGYTTAFEAKALASSSGGFATEAFRHNPLVAIQHDGDLSHIEDNTKLNSIIAHENMMINEKFKAQYVIRVNAFLLMGTNQPVKITDAKSGIIRRLIDVRPTGITFPPKHYQALMSRIDFELGAIAYHCLQVYQEMGKNAYSGYRPTEMMYQTDIFFNFVEAYFDIFKAQDGITLKQAYALYKTYCEETGITRPIAMYKMRDELGYYFEEFHDRIKIDDIDYRSYYSGFKSFKAPLKDAKAFSLVIDETESLLDGLYADCPAQYAKLDEYGKEIPGQKWAKVKTTLASLDTSQLHFVKIPENHIVIDFDLKDTNGAKSLERNLAAASNWPPTYAELSQGGNGVHLHYVYDGDITQISSNYSLGIEVKTLLGDASLRRRLTKCNNFSVATINSGLPIKEKKVLTDNAIKSEKGLRDLITRNLKKEIHPGTKPSIDFIQKILDDAYASDMTYDVTDMRARIIAFAGNSSNQALQCLKIVQKMKFASEDRGEITVDTSDATIAFFDVEVYPNLFVVCWKYWKPDLRDATVVKMVNPTSQEVERLFKLKLVGFYNRRYDNHILYARYMGYSNEDLFALSQKLVVGKDHRAMFGEAYDLSYTDVWDFSSIKQSLKKFEIDLDILHMELDLPWDKPVPEDQWHSVVDYCANDVIATEAVFEDRHSDYVARQILAELSGLSMNQSTAAHTAKIIFGNDKDYKESFVYTDLSKEFPGYVYDMGVSSYRGKNPSEGGYVYAEPGIYQNVTVLDVASMHPTSIIQLNLFGPYTAQFSTLVEARLAIKAKDYKRARLLFGGNLGKFLLDDQSADTLSYALKIIINTVYGLTSTKWDSAFRDNRNKDNIVAKRGALFMIDLKNFVQEQGFQVVHIKTDSIKIPDLSTAMLEQIMLFGEKYGYTFTNEGTYDKFCLTTKADYIACKDRDPSGEWTAVGATFQHPYVFKTLFSKEPIVFKDLREAKSVQKGAMYLDFEHDRPMALHEGMRFVGRTGLFCPVKEGARLYRVDSEKVYAVADTKNYLWLEAHTVEGLNALIDMSYFERKADEARKTIESFGDFEEFVS